VAQDWVDKVGNVIGDIAGTISLDKLQTNPDRRRSSPAGR
jgi:hypothetical protein